MAPPLGSKKANYAVETPRLAAACLPHDAGEVLRGTVEGGFNRRRDGSVSFADSPHNLLAIKRMYPNTVIEYPPSLPGIAANSYAPKLGEYEPKTAWFGEFQKTAYERARATQYYALFMDRGTGKTKIGIDVAGHHFAQGRITGVLIITFKGIHTQWVDTHDDSPLPKHLGSVAGQPIAYKAAAWDGKCKVPFAEPQRDNVLEFYAQTYPGIDSNGGRVATKTFIERHKGRLMVIIDESHGIANFSSTRTENCLAIGLHARVRLIMTGSPIAKSPEDEWVQSLFLSEKIVGCRYQATFRRQYCETVRGEIIGWKNLDEFRGKLAPYVYRVTKTEALGLPPQVWSPFYFELSKEQRRLYNELRKNFLTQLRSGEIVTVQNAAVCLLRLQQITCGVLVDTDGTRHDLENPRLQALLDLLQEYPDGKKLIVWCRFVEDIHRAATACTALGNVAALHGAVPVPVRQAALDKFMHGDSVRILVANPAVIGTGVDGWQHVCSDAIYYSNSYNAVERWQSEDRLHRIGTTEHVTYRDIVALNTVDGKILANHKAKQNLSEYLLSPLDTTPLKARPDAMAQMLELLE